MTGLDADVPPGLEMDAQELNPLPFDSFEELFFFPGTEEFPFMFPAGDMLGAVEDTQQIIITMKTTSGEHCYKPGPELQSMDCPPLELPDPDL